MNFGKIIDWIGKNLSRIKTIGVLVLIVFFAISLGRNGCNRSEMEEMVERITGLNVRNDILFEDVKERDSLLIAKELRIGQLKDSVDSSKERLASLERDYEDLEQELEDISDSLLQIPVDSSYKFLTTEAYPFPGYKRYPFNEPQVKGIHLTYLEKLKLEEMNYSLVGQIGELKYQTLAQDSVVYESAMVMSMMKKSRQDLEEVILNKDEIIEVQQEQISKKKRKATIWHIVGGTVVVVLLGFAIGGG